MEFLKKEIILANGKSCVLQSPGPKDAQKMMDYLKQTAAETHFMLRLPEEVTMTVEAEEKYLKSALEDPLSLMINAVVDGKLAGNVGLSPIAPRQKTRHRVSVGIAVRKEYWGMGLGRLLMQEARKADITKIRRTGSEGAINITEPADTMLLCKSPALAFVRINDS